MTSFATRFKQLRKSKGLSQYATAELLGVSRSIITMYETGNRVPSFDMLQKIASCFGVGIDYLMTGETYHPDFYEVFSGDYSKSLDASAPLTDLQQQLIDKLLSLPEYKQKEALSYIQYLLNN